MTCFNRLRPTFTCRFARIAAGYCDFTVVAGKDHLADEYLRALEVELTLLERPREMQTLFIGGGTPTHLDVRRLDQLLTLVTKWFPFPPGYEFSVEANPQGLGVEKIDLLAAHGVNRVSLGVQSFDSHVLQTLERDHDAEQIAETVTLLSRRIPNFSLDLIFGVPGQSLALWHETLARAVAAGAGPSFDLRFDVRKRNRLLVAAGERRVDPGDG